MRTLRSMACTASLWMLASSSVFAADPPAASASAPAVAASASGDAAHSDCRHADLAIEQALPASAAAHRVGQTLRIVATGGCVKGIKDHVAKNPARPALTLVLDDVEMKGIKPARPLTGDDGALIIPFELSRDSLDVQRQSG